MRCTILSIIAYFSIAHTAPVQVLYTNPFLRYQHPLVELGPVVKNDDQFLLYPSIRYLALPQNPDYANTVQDYFSMFGSQFNMFQNQTNQVFQDAQMNAQTQIGQGFELAQQGFGQGFEQISQGWGDIQQQWGGGSGRLPASTMELKPIAPKPLEKSGDLTKVAATRRLFAIPSYPYFVGGFQAPLNPLYVVQAQQPSVKTGRSMAEVNPIKNDKFLAQVAPSEEQLKSSAPENLVVEPIAPIVPVVPVVEILDEKKTNVEISSRSQDIQASGLNELSNESELKKGEELTPQAAAEPIVAELQATNLAAEVQAKAIDPLITIKDEPQVIQEAKAVPTVEEIPSVEKENKE